jgi:CRISPR-associated protein Cmr4
MYKEASILFFYTETPLHAGSGSNVSHIDMPVQREKHTGYPIVQSSGVKGAFRHWVNGIEAKKNVVKYMFGPEPENNASSDHGGSMGFTDAHLLFFPVRSFYGGFAWITCPFVLNRFSRRLEMLDLAPLPTVDEIPDDKIVIEPDKFIADNDRVILEDFSFNVTKNQNENFSTIADRLCNDAIPVNNGFNYIKNSFKKRLAIVSDNTFKDFVTLSTEVVTRINIGENGVVKTGALWTQELLPCDCILYCMVIAKDIEDIFSAKESMDSLKKHICFNNESTIIQMGGDETVGRGILRIRLLSSDNSLDNKNDKDKDKKEKKKAYNKKMKKKKGN